jgi:putative transposase
MPYDPDRHHRRSIRLRGYDYRQAGAYFVTICTYGRQQLFDDLARRQIAEHQWLALAHAGERGKAGGHVALDAFVVMPDHIHGIIVITTPNDDSADRAGFVGGDDPAEAQQGLALNTAGMIYDDIAKRTPACSPGAPAAPLHRGAADAHADAVDDAPRGPRSNVAAGSLGAIVRSYKAAVSRRINSPHHIGPVWQRGYYEHIIRDESELGAVRRYIAANPARRAEARDDIHALLARMETKERRP